MADTDSASSLQPVQRGIPSAFENLITNIPMVLDSLIAQLPTESILALYHTSSHLQKFLKKSPTSWRYISWRLYQPAAQTATPTNNVAGVVARQPSNYALDQILIYVINPFSTCLVSLDLDNTSVSGATLFQTVMLLRKDTLQHLSVRGCKNVSLKYHINPWLMMHAMMLDWEEEKRAPGFEKLALKSLYTYRCRHHRRRPYLPSSLARKESDSEPTHELVLTCHKLGIWTDTAWCTTPGARCFRRRGYATMRVPQDPREVWVVFDRLWRSGNWLGPVPDRNSSTPPPSKRQKRDCRTWEADEYAMNGESISITGEGKKVPAHLRSTHKQFVDEIYCDSCHDLILERCEQCSVLMHCSGCRKTLCSSCAFDRPYLRNRTAPSDERNKFWWAPGCAISPCSMQDQDSTTANQGANIGQNHPTGVLPTIKFKWCCTEPVFSGGGGITFGNGSTRDANRIRAAPLRSGEGWEDPEFSSRTYLPAENSPQSDAFTQVGSPLSRSSGRGPGGRWPSIDGLFLPDPHSESHYSSGSVPRILCDDCHNSEQWKIRCKACSIPLCLKHDMKERLKVRICGYKDLPIEKAEWKARQKALKLIAMFLLRRRLRMKVKAAEEKLGNSESSLGIQSTVEAESNLSSQESTSLNAESGSTTPRPQMVASNSNMLSSTILDEIVTIHGGRQGDIDLVNRPLSPGSDSTGPSSRTSSPTPSTRSIPITPKTTNLPRSHKIPESPEPLWQGCQSFFCPATRTPGDHRRRCIGVMRQCVDCKVHVCEQCVNRLEPSCPCKGCRAPSNEQVTMAEMLADGNMRFYCPNCRWVRMKTGKCKVKVKAKASSAKDSRKNRKPVAERSPPSEMDDSVEAVGDFFEAMEIENANSQAHSETASSTAIWSSSTISATEGNPEEIRQLHDMGALARDLIRRIQTLRQQFGPGTLAALALPHITMEEPRTAFSGDIDVLLDGGAGSVQNDMHTNNNHGGQDDLIQNVVDDGEPGPVIIDAADTEEASSEAGGA